MLKNSDYVFCKLCGGVVTVNIFEAFDVYDCANCNICCRNGYTKFFVSDNSKEYVIEHHDCSITVSIIYNNKRKLIEYELKEKDLTVQEARDIFQKVKKRLESIKILV